MLGNRAAMAGVRRDEPAPTAHKLDLVSQAFQDLYEPPTAGGPDKHPMEIAADTTPGIRVFLADIRVLPEAFKLALEGVEYLRRNISAAQTGGERLQSDADMVD